MDYIKKYKESLERARKLQENSNGMILKKWLWEIFPELKEDEDEKIRKALIDYFDDANKADENPLQSYGIHTDKAITWLENQGKQKEYTFKSLPRLLDMIEPTNKAKAYCQKLIDTLVKERYITDAKIVGECLKTMNGKNIPMAIMDENCDKQNPIIEMKSPEESLRISSKKYSEIVNECLYGESKSTNNVESKFKVGKWIVNNVSKDIFLIKSINNGYYTLEDIKGNVISPCMPPYESEFHLWSIEDAKDGDILFQDLIGGKTFIYNGVNPNMAILYSFIISNDGKDVLPYHIGKPNTGIGNIEENKNIIHPATKEQCDLLFQKIKEAGYEWDAEKKELKDKPVDKIEPIFNVGDKIQYLKGCGTIMTIEKIENGEYIFCNNMGHTTIENGNKCYLVEQKPTEWSENDEDMIQALYACIDATIKSGMNYIYFDSKSILIGKVKNWIKSLKGRVQPKQEWGDKDNYYRNCIIQIIKEIKNAPLKRKEDWDAYINWLKSLIPQNQWKPSNEQIYALHSVVTELKHSDNKYQETIEDLYQDLKKLREE